MPKIKNKKLRIGLKLSLIIIIAMWICFIRIMGFVFGGILSLIGTFAIFAMYASWMVEIDKTNTNVFFTQKYAKKEQKENITKEDK